MEKVSFGKNDWLFLDHDANNVMAQHRGELPMTEDMLKRWGEVWDRRWQTFSGHAYFLIVPDPQSIFPECLPFPPVSVRPVHQLLDALKSRPISGGRTSGRKGERPSPRLHAKRHALDSLRRLYRLSRFDGRRSAEAPQCPGADRSGYCLYPLRQDRRSRQQALANAELQLRTMHCYGTAIP